MPPLVRGRTEAGLVETVLDGVQLLHGATLRLRLGQGGRRVGNTEVLLDAALQLVLAVVEEAGHDVALGLLRRKHVDIVPHVEATEQVVELCEAVVQRLVLADAVGRREVVMLILSLVLHVNLLQLVVEVALEGVQGLRVRLEHLTGHIVRDAHHAQWTRVFVQGEGRSHKLARVLHGAIVNFLHGGPRVRVEQQRYVLRAVELALVAGPAEEGRPHQSTNTLVHHSRVQLASDGH